MDDLRLILLVLGIAVVAGIYLSESIKQRSLQRRRTLFRSQPATDAADSGVAVANDDSDGNTAEPADLRRFMVDAAGADQRVLSAGPGPRATPHTRTENAGDDEAPDQFPSARETTSPYPVDSDGLLHYADLTPDRIISLHVIPAPGRSFGGRAILDAMRAADLHYGPMKIFHHYGSEDSRSSQPLFSVASMLEPGYFELDRMDDYTARGLTFFLCVPTPVDAKVVFELMLGTARLLAYRLGGEVRGTDRERLDENQLAALRARLGR